MNASFCILQVLVSISAVVCFSPPAMILFPPTQILSLSPSMVWLDQTDQFVISQNSSGDAFEHCYNWWCNGSGNFAASWNSASLILPVRQCRLVYCSGLLLAEAIFTTACQTISYCHKTIKNKWEMRCLYFGTELLNWTPVDWPLIPNLAS